MLPNRAIISNVTGRQPNKCATVCVTAITAYDVYLSRYSFIYPSSTPPVPWYSHIPVGVLIVRDNGNFQSTSHIYSADIIWQTAGKLCTPSAQDRPRHSVKHTLTHSRWEEILSEGSCLGDAWFAMYSETRMILIQLISYIQHFSFRVCVMRVPCCSDDHDKCSCL